MPKKKIVSQAIQTTLESADLLRALLNLGRFPTISQFQTAWSGVQGAPPCPLTNQNDVDEFCDSLRNGAVTVAASTLLSYYDSLNSNFGKKVVGGPPPQEWTP